MENFYGSPSALKVQKERVFITDLAPLNAMLVSFCSNLPPTFARMSVAPLPVIPHLDGIHCITTSEKSIHIWYILFQGRQKASSLWPYIQ